MNRKVLEKEEKKLSVQKGFARLSWSWAAAAEGDEKMMVAIIDNFLASSLRLIVRSKLTFEV